jgi:hypothetical protein
MTKFPNMKKTLLLFGVLLGFTFVQAQIADFSKEARIEIPAKAHQLLASLKKADREIISCLRTTQFFVNAGVADSSTQTITTVDETNGYLTLTQTTHAYENGQWVFQEEVVLYGTDQVGSEELFDSPLDSLAFFGTDPVTGQKILVVKGIVTLTPTDKLERIDIFLNTGFFGLPLGTILFGVNLFYYDNDDYLIATASKEVDFFAGFLLVNADTAHYQNNVAGQPLVETNWQWEDNAYVPTNRITRTYPNPGDQEDTIMFESWNEGTSQWDFNSLSLLSYTAAGNLSAEIVQVGSPGMWQTVQEILYTYDAQDRLTELLQQLVDPNGNTSPFDREIYQYDQPQGWIYLKMDQSFQAGSWVTYERTIHEECDNVGTAPEAPTQLTAQQSMTFGAIDLTWSDNSTHEQGYRIERSLNGIDFDEIGAVGESVTAHTDNDNLEEGTTYYYRVRAFNLAGFSPYSNVAEAKTASTSVSRPELAGFHQAYFSADGMLTLVFGQDADPRLVHVYDVQGRPLVHARLNGAGLQQVEASHLPQGLYVVQVHFGNGTHAATKVLRP